MSDPAEIFLDNLISNFGHPYGAERSIKFSQSELRSSRLLLTIHKNALGLNTEKNLFDLLSELSFPNEHKQEISSRLEQADIVHFGYEDYGQGFFYKCYVEFTQQIFLAEEQNKLEPVLVHFAIKWDPAKPEKVRFTQYHLRRFPSLDAIKNHVREVYQDCMDSLALQTTLEIIDMEVVSSIKDDLMIMSVSEPDSARYSYDINLYNADLRLSAVSSQLVKIVDYFAADTEEWEKLYQSDRDSKLGHVAGGIDEKGKEFYTVYFGVEERYKEINN
ncbi:MAG: hypothetical protein HN764_11480 [Gammaproteobacteria bacterium]|jgi:hypothetical protein|nr:hypothetical protein [Gammaproteobacteria bacterium]